MSVLIDYKPAYKSVREDKGLTIKDAAAMLGVAPATLSRWERGITKPRLTPLFRMCDIYGVTVSELVGISA